MSTSLIRRRPHRSTLIRLPKGAYTSKLRLAVVLGARIAPDGQPTEGLKRRLYRACRLVAGAQTDSQERALVGNSGVRSLDALILSGGATLGPETPSEAAVMEQFCLGLGVGRRQLWREEAARTTRENALYSLTLLYRLCDHGGRIDPRVCLVTEWPHIPRALMVFTILQWRLRRTRQRGGLPTPSFAFRPCPAAGSPRWRSAWFFAGRELFACLADAWRVWRVPIPPISDMSHPETPPDGK